MRYLLMIGGGSDTAEPAAESICGEAEARAWAAEMERRGVLRGGELLHPPSDATAVRVRDGEVLLSDGPFAQTKDQIGGFTLIECTGLDEAIEVAAKHPVARLRHDRGEAGQGAMTPGVSPRAGTCRARAVGQRRARSSVYRAHS